LWDQINVLEDKEEIRDELTFDNHLKELTSAILGDDALRNQKDYLKTTPKPEKLSVKQWVNQNKNINSYLPLMQPNGRSFSEEDLIKEVISKNIPTVWVKGFKMFKLHLKISIKDILSELTVIEEQIKTRPKGNQDNPNKKHLKNPCRIHGTYEWDEKTDATNRSREHRRTEEDNRNFARTTRNHNDNADETSYDEYEYNCITKQASKTNTPSSEILIALPHQAGSKKILLTLDF